MTFFTRYFYIGQLIFCIFSIFCTDISISVNGSHFEKEHVALAKWKYNDYQLHIALLIFFIIVILFRTIYHKMEYIAHYIPESLMLIVIGAIFGLVIARAEVMNEGFRLYALSPSIFFNYLLPPIILDASYTIYNRTFGDYFGCIILYAVIGTVMNFLLVGLLMFGLYRVGVLVPGKSVILDLKFFLLFASLIVAVDPVAVLAIFQDIGVELGLYYMVFGESLLNDAVTVVLYEIMIAMIPTEHITTEQVLIGFFSFFSISIGGFVVGIIFGIINSLVSQFNNDGDIVLIFLFAYFSYIFGNTIGWSGIVAMIGCGIFQAAYTLHNMGTHEAKVVQEITRQAASLTESIIFLFLGVELFKQHYYWNISYYLLVLLICLIARAVSVVFLTYFVNKTEMAPKKITHTQQIIMTWGGLRGAVAFSLASLLHPDLFAEHGADKRDLIMSSTLVIILCTVGIFGLSMKPLVRFLDIPLHEEKEITLFDEINVKVIDYTLFAIEAISDAHRKSKVVEYFYLMDKRYLRPVLQLDTGSSEDNTFELYEQVALKLNWGTMRPEISDRILEAVPERFREKFVEENLHIAHKLKIRNIASKVHPGKFSQLLASAIQNSSQQQPNTTVPQVDNPQNLQSRFLRGLNLKPGKSDP